ncbi:hypothetical protein FOZ63_019288, partial [Perkinsus olseni]
AAGQMAYIDCTSSAMQSLDMGQALAAEGPLLGASLPPGVQRLLEEGPGKIRAHCGVRVDRPALPAESPVLMRAGGWRSLSVLEYLHESSEEKAKLASCYMLTG